MHVATDLHGHTSFSDGRHTPEEYVDLKNFADGCRLTLALAIHI